jgi:ribose transport system ATP-binding protein
LDEPTRGIDIGAKEDIYNLLHDLSKAGITFIITSSEIPELFRICNKMLVLSAGQQTGFVETAQTNSIAVLKLAFQKV